MRARQCPSGVSDQDAARLDVLHTPTMYIKIDTMYDGYTKRSHLAKANRSKNLT